MHRLLLIATLLGALLTIGLSAASAADQQLPSFAAATTYKIGQSPDSIAAGDVTGNGSPDLVTANFDASTVSVLANNGDGTFQAARDYATGLTPFAVAVGDLDGDGKADVVTANLWDDTISVRRVGHSLRIPRQRGRRARAEERLRGRSRPRRGCDRRPERRR